MYKAWRNNSWGDQARTWNDYPTPEDKGTWNNTAPSNWFGHGFARLEIEQDDVKEKTIDKSFKMTWNDKRQVAGITFPSQNLCDEKVIIQVIVKYYDDDDRSVPIIRMYSDDQDALSTEYKTIMLGQQLDWKTNEIIVHVFSVMPSTVTPGWVSEEEHGKNAYLLYIDPEKIAATMHATVRMRYTDA